MIGSNIAEFEPCSDWSYPANVNQVDWTYPSGKALSNTTAHVAGYYGRLLSWLIKGYLIDEFGVNITGGPQVYRVVCVRVCTHV